MTSKVLFDLITSDGRITTILKHDSDEPDAFDARGHRIKEPRYELLLDGEQILYGDSDKMITMLGETFHSTRHTYSNKG